MAKRKSKTSKAHYVDNAKFLEAMIEYKKEYNEAVKKGKELPMISEYLGSVFLKLAQRLSSVSYSHLTLPTILLV